MSDNMEALGPKHEDLVDAVEKLQDTLQISKPLWRSSISRRQACQLRLVR
jgi:hypothetical protein